MNETALLQAEVLVRVIATTELANEIYLCELDAVVGDGDFGYSLARGFERLLKSWDELACDDVSSRLIKSASVLSGRIGSTSGPIWETALLRAGMALKGNPSPTAPTRSPPFGPRSTESSNGARPMWAI